MVEDHTEEDTLAKCEGNLLEYIRCMQDKVDEQLDLIEKQVSCKWYTFLNIG
jgi:hypothetical protein